MISIASRFFATIKSRLYFSFICLVMLFILNGVITLIILHKNKVLSNQISTVIDPATHALIEFHSTIIESKMLSTNWVFIRSNKEDKDALLQIHSTKYPLLKKRLLRLAPKMFDKSVNDSLNKVYNNFENLIAIQKEIIQKLNSFESYDDPFTRMEMELKVEDELIPRTAALLKAMDQVLNVEQAIRKNAHDKLDDSSLKLRYILLVLVVLVIVIGIVCSIYLANIITNPIHKLKNLINEMGQGKIKQIKYAETKSEFGLMVNSINKLSANLESSANFAKEIGKRNFTINFKPISEEDVLGKALITMRDNLRESDHRLNQAQQIAKLGSWEFDAITKRTLWSDELFAILGYKIGEIEPSLHSFMEMVMENDRPQLKQILSTGINEKAFSIECKLLSKDNVLKDVYIQGQAELNEENVPIKIVGIVQDITNQKNAEAKLQKNYAELIKTNKELDKFVYSVSHDLRAPLSSMLGMLQLTEEDCEDVMIKTNLGMVKDSVLKLDGFIQDILAYSRNARLEVKKDEINIEPFLKEIASNLKHMNGKQSLVSIFIKTNQEIPFRSDPSRLSIVLNNLISNAIRYYNPGAPQPFVKISADVYENEAVIIIEDNGIGIKSELHSKVFEMFYRVSENSVGSGLGLYIVKESIEKMNGSIELESTPGKGSKFTLSIPN